jgi:predicted transcriptional regulator
VRALVARRPCTLEDIAAGLGIHRSEALKAVTALVTEGRIGSSTHGGRLFYTAADAVVHTSTEERP